MRVPQEHDGARGSLRWIQHFVNEDSEALDRAIEDYSGGRIATPIDWRSPLAADDYAEYRDSHFLELLGVSLDHRSLESFWPARGPQWDALGVAADDAVVLVEAKANIPEVVSGGTAASGAALELIRQSLAETAEHLGADTGVNWAGTFYQYTNRLAHLHLLHELNGVDTWLVNLYFVSDPDTNGPATVEEWRAGIRVLKGALGLKRHRLLGRVVEVFVDVDR